MVPLGELSFAASHDLERTADLLVLRSLPPGTHSHFSCLVLLSAAHRSSVGRRHGAPLFLHVVFSTERPGLCVLYSSSPANGDCLVPRSFSAFRDAWHVLLHDFHLRREAPAQEKYNAAQQISYTAIILMGAGSILTGLAIYKPVQLGWLTALCGGYTMARLIHFILTAGYVAFFVVHVVQVALAGWNNFRSMVIGYELAGERD